MSKFSSSAFHVIAARIIHASTTFTVFIQQLAAASEGEKKTRNQKRRAIIDGSEERREIEISLILADAPER
jgi:hypothetical protein